LSGRKRDLFPDRRTEDLAEGSRVDAGHLPASELEYHLLLAKDLKLIKPKDHAELSPRATELKRMLTALLQKLNADC